MSAVRDLTGERFGRLTVIQRCGSDKNGRALFECKCECGNLTVATGKLLLTGRKKSCGCLTHDILLERNTVHGNAARGKVERLYKVWLSMRSRIYNPHEAVYKHYGGRGITMCKEWDDYQAFRTWAYANGYDETAKRGKCTIDRIDVNGNYCPENCRFVDQSTQMKNIRPRNGKHQ